MSIKQTDLIASNEQQLLRAKSLGFDTNKIWYHGSNKAFEAFDINAEPIERSGNPPGIYLTPHKDEAHDYGTVVYALYARTKHPYIIGESKVTTAMLKKYAEVLKKYTSYNESWVDDVIVPALKKTGDFKPIDGALIKEVMIAGGYDSWQDGRHLCVFEPAMLRLTTAQFDSKLKNLNNLYA